MHIHANNSLLLASIGAGREETQAVQAKKAADVRRKLSGASRILDAEEGAIRKLAHTDPRSHGSEAIPGEDDSFGHFLSVEA